MFSSSFRQKHRNNATYCTHICQPGFGSGIIYYFIFSCVWFLVLTLRLRGNIFDGFYLVESEVGPEGEEAVVLTRRPGDVKFGPTHCYGFRSVIPETSSYVEKYNIM